MGFFRTAILLAAMTALFMGIGFLLGGMGGMMVALVIAIAMNGFAYWNSDKMILKMHGAVEVDERTAPEYYGIVRELAQRSGLPMPKVYIIQTEQPNAFATGRNPENAAVAASSGLLNMMNRNEVAGVMAHELAHIKNRDILTMTVTATFAGAISMLANFAMFFGNDRDRGGFIGSLLIMFLAPMAASIVQMAISRSREYEADRIGAEICGNPLWLASALAKLDQGTSRIPNRAAENNPASAHLFIANPLSGGNRDRLFSTHPNMNNRIRLLEEMAATMPSGRSSYNDERYGSSGRYASEYEKPRSENTPKTDEKPWRKGPWG